MRMISGLRGRARLGAIVADGGRRPHRFACHVQMSQRDSLRSERSPGRSFFERLYGNLRAAV